MRDALADEDRDLLQWEEREAGEVRLAHPAEMSRAEILKASNYGKVIGEDAGFPFCQIWLPPVYTDVENDRYFDLSVPLTKLLSIRRPGFSVEGNPSNFLRILFFGKCYLQAYPEKDFEESGRMRLGSIADATFQVREFSEALYYLDDTFCFELIKAGRIDAAPYAARFDRKEIEELLEASIRACRNDNIAVLLEQKQKFFDGDDELEI